jgi:hypothetical protein
LLLGAIMQSAINAAYFREKVQICRRLAKILAWNDPQLLLMAEDFQKRETELVVNAHRSPSLDEGNDTSL